MKTLKKYKGKLTEWIVFTFIFFFLYDIIWAVADFEDFKQSIDGYYICLFVDLVYCAIFSCISLSVTKLLLRQRFVKLAEEERSRYNLNKYTYCRCLRIINECHRVRIHRSRRLGDILSARDNSKSTGPDTYDVALF